VPAAQKPSLLGRLRRWCVQAVVVAGVVVVLVGATHGTVYLWGLQVERIALTGAVRQVSEQTVSEQVAAYVESGFLAADLEAIRAQLETLPWVYTANVRRRWPDTLSIHIVEQRPIARWGEQGFLNHEGQFFAAAPTTAWSHLPLLEGGEGAQQRLVDGYQTIEALLAQTGLGVVWLAEDAIGQLSVELDNGTFLALGNDHLVTRMQRFVALHRQSLSGQHIARIDLRYRYGAAVVMAEPQLANYQLTQEEVD